MTGPTPALRRTDYWLAAMLFVLVVGPGQLRLVPGVVGVYHDDGIYAATAKALAEGRGYRLLNLPGEPAQTKYPILYPAALAAVCRLAPAAPNGWWLMQQMTLASAAALVALSYLYLVRFGHAGRGAALAAGLLCASAPTFLYFGTSLLSEAPFGLLVVIALWAVDREMHMERVRRWGPIWLGAVVAL